MLLLYWTSFSILMYSLDLRPPPKFALHFFRRRGPSYCTSCATTMPPTAGSNFLETRTLVLVSCFSSMFVTWTTITLCRSRLPPSSLDDEALRIGILVVFPAPICVVDPLLLQGVVSLFSFSELLHPKGLLPCSAKGSGTIFGHLLSIGSTAFARLVGRLSVLGVTPPPAWRPRTSQV